MQGLLISCLGSIRPRSSATLLGVAFSLFPVLELSLQARLLNAIGAMSNTLFFVPLDGMPDAEQWDTSGEWLNGQAIQHRREPSVGEAQDRGLHSFTQRA